MRHYGNYGKRKSIFSSKWSLKSRHVFTIFTGYGGDYGGYGGYDNGYKSYDRDYGYDRSDKYEYGYNGGTTVPALGDIVTARVVSVNPRFAKVLIECVREITLNEPFRAQIRKEDIREFEKDKIEMFKSFRPGDVILARVLSFGEASSGYLLSTAENELGVVIAKSEESGVNMIPVSWTEMQCPKTYNKELRKIAKVIPENLATKPENLWNKSVTFSFVYIILTNFNFTRIFYSFFNVP